MERTRCVLGVDVGGAKLTLGIVDVEGRILESLERRSPFDSEKKMIDQLAMLVSEGLKSANEANLKPAAVGLGVAGFILHENGIVVESPNIAWREVPLRRIVSERTGFPVFLDNDANAACLGEKLAGAAKGVADFIYLTLGTGIGGGICIDGKIYRGFRGTAAEFGHVAVDPDGPLCGCGRRGCLESLASGTALKREAIALAKMDKNSLLWKISGGEIEKIDGEAISLAADESDSVACEAFSRVSRYLGIGIASLIHIFDPEMVVLGGGMSASGHLFINDVRKAVRENGNDFLVRDANVCLSTLGREAGVVGAASIAWEGIGECS
ncbi:MAG: ROK family glucokinase [Actinomycetota bacterium]|nr:ROK family glucokinase [Actinomycetota bacterium]